MCKDLLFINPFCVFSQLPESQLDDRLAEAECGMRTLIKDKLGKEASEAYEAVINGTVMDMEANKDVITDEDIAKEITGAWRDLGKARDWLKAQGALPVNEGSTFEPAPSPIEKEAQPF